MIKLAIIGLGAFVLLKLLGGKASANDGTGTVTFEVTTPGLDANGYPVDGAGRPSTDAGVDWDTSTSAVNTTIS